MKTTTNYGFKKPELTDNYNVDDQNFNSDLLDEKLKEIEKNSDNAKTLVSSHTSATGNPHSVTKEQVGLGNVPNVATNDQTPTYVAATENAALSSGEKLSVAFGKIAKAVSSLVSHLADTVCHITAAERTTWNSKANGTHTHTKSQITDFPTSLPASDVSSWAKASTKPSYTKSEVGLGSVDNTADSAKSVKYATSAGNADTLDNLHASSFIQTSQSAKVIVSTTAPSDTTAVWIVPS